MEYTRAEELISIFQKKCALLLLVNMTSEYGYYFLPDSESRYYRMTKAQMRILLQYFNQHENWHHITQNKYDSGIFRVVYREVYPQLQDENYQEVWKLPI